MSKIKAVIAELKATPTPVVLATIIVAGGVGFSFIMLRNQQKYSAESIVLMIVITNSLAQMCIDFFKGDSKPIFSALARLIPMIAAAGYFMMKK